MEINEYLLKVINMMKEVEELDFFPASSKLSQTEFRLLREVILEQEKGGEIISSELARRLGITRSAVSQIVSKLEKRDIVIRVDSPIDKKIAYVHLSEKARALFEEQCLQANEFMDKIVKSYGEEKLTKLIKQFDAFMVVFGQEYEKRAKTKFQPTENFKRGLVLSSGSSLNIAK